MAQNNILRDPTHYLTSSKVAARYDVTLMSLWRWLTDPKYADLNFPKPDLRVNGRRLWKEATLVKWERYTAAHPMGSAVPPPPPRKLRIEKGGEDG
jgi:hypothetical protein